MKTFCRILLLTFLFSAGNLSVSAVTFSGDSLDYSKDTLFSSLSDKKNIIVLNLFDLILTDITVNYERLLGKKSKLGLKLGLTYGINTRSSMEYDFENLFSLNTGFNYYPRRHKERKYFLGLTLKAGMAEYSNYIQLWGMHPEYYYISDTYFYSKVLIDNGFRFSSPSGFYFAAVLGIGLAFNDYPLVKEISPAINMMMNMGIRF